jgi:farnesyl diphosphate synthase
LQSFADCIGLAFQVRDDILDVTSDTERLGKPQGSDQLNGKVTYVSLLGLERAQSKASELSEEALQALQGLSCEADMLRDLAHYIVARDN